MTENAAPRRRRRQPAAVRAAVLPPGAGDVALPPDPAPNADHETDVKEPKLPAGTRRSPSLAKLKERAAKANKDSRARIEVSVRIDTETYAALVALAETYRCSIADIHRQCLDDGLRKYVEFRSPFNANPFVRTTPMRAHPDIVEPVGNDRPHHSGAESPRTIHDTANAVRADDLTAPIPDYDAAVERSAVDRLGSFLPQSGGALVPSMDDEAADPLAPRPQVALTEHDTIEAEVLVIEHEPVVMQ